MLIISSSSNKEHHNSTLRTNRAHNLSALFRKDPARSDGGWEAEWCLAEDLRSMWKLGSAREAGPFIILGQDWVRSRD